MLEPVTRYSKFCEQREQRIWEKQFGELFCSIFVSYKSPVLIISFLFMGENFAPPLKICRTAVRQILYYF